MASEIIGIHDWSGGREIDGHRTYNISLLIRSSEEDGPANVLNTPGLYIPGSFWSVGDDIDVDAYCTPEMTIRRYDARKGEKHKFWTVDQVFTTKPLDVCVNDAVSNPLLAPVKVTGSFRNKTIQVAYDRFGLPILSSSWELLTGPGVEFDDMHPTIRIEQNVPLLEEDLLMSMRETVNDAPLWGFPARHVKLSGVSFGSKYYSSCLKTYTRTLEFEVNLDSFDRDLLDEGTKALRGNFDQVTGNYILKNINGKPPDFRNPKHFDRYQDRQGNTTRVILNGVGLPAGVIVGNHIYQVFISIQDGNTNNALTDSEWWVVAVGDPVFYDSLATYLRGNTVYHNNTLWLCLRTTSGFSPTAMEAIHPGVFWLDIGDLFPRGVWDSSTTYATGDTVTPTADVIEEQIGYIHVEYYDESNFLLLGIPTIL